MGIAIRRLDGELAGRVYIERDDLAEAMIDTGQAERATFGDHEVAAAAPHETPESTKPVGKMSRTELEAELERRGITVGEGSGKGGSILKKDLVSALS